MAFANLIGSWLILLSFYVQWNPAAFIANACWVAISLQGSIAALRDIRE